MVTALLVDTTWKWVRRNLTWSNSRQSWFERLGAVVLLSGAGALVWFAPLLPPAVQGAAWMGLFLAFAILLRRGWVKLFGPVFFYDLIRTSRRRPFFPVRMLYLLVMAGLFYSSATMTVTHGRGDFEEVLELFAANLDPRQITQMTEAFSFLFLGVQIVTAFLLTPVMVAGAIAELRQRRTLEFLLATDLRNHEIVLGTLASRLAGLLLILLGGLPILGLMQFLGGVDPHLLLAGFAATGLTVVSLGSLSILNSVTTRRPLVAIARTYLEALAYLALSAGFKGLLWLASRPGSPVPGLAGFPTTPEWTSPVTLEDVSEWLNAGNIGTATFELGMALDRGTSLDAVLPDLLEGYAWFHGLFAAVCLVWAVIRLRPIALKIAEGPTRGRGRGNRKRRPLLARWPMLGKEIFSEGQFASRRLARLGVGFLVVASLLPALGVLGFVIFAYPFVDWDGLAEFLNAWLRIVGTVVACMLLLVVAIRAAASVSGERDGQTLDVLLTTPLSSRAILGGKWFGAFLAPRRGWWWLAAIWGLAWLGGALEPWLVPRLLFTWLVYAAFLASLGLWFSVRCLSATRAILGVILAILVVMAGHWLMVVVYAVLEDLLYSRENREWLRAVGQWLEAIHLYTLTPPAVFDLLASQQFESHWQANGDRRDRENFAAGFGLFLYTVWAVLLWMGAYRTFRRVAHRAPVRPAKRDDLAELARKLAEMRSLENPAEAPLQCSPEMGGPP